MSTGLWDSIHHRDESPPLFPILRLPQGNIHLTTERESSNVITLTPALH